MVRQRVPVEALGVTTTRVFLALCRVYARDRRATVRAVQLECGYNPNTGAVHRHLVALRDAGLVTWEPGTCGTLRPLVWPVTLPSSTVDARTGPDPRGSR